jgi:uncharacterized protein (DUF2267 family)
MSATGLEVFDKTVQTTNLWLEEINAVIGPDRQLAWHVLGVVLRSLRDRLPIELAVHLGSQLPILVRGAYYDQWTSTAQPSRIRSTDEFVARIAEGLSDVRPVAPSEAIRAVFQVISHHVDPGQVRKVQDALPESIRDLWPQTAVA